MSSRHRQTSARRTLGSERSLFLQRQLISVSAFAAGKHEPDRLRSRFCSAPALRVSRSKSRLDGIVFILRGDLHHGCPLDIEPAFTARPNRLWSWGNKPLTHTPQFNSGATWRL